MNRRRFSRLEIKLTLNLDTRKKLARAVVRCKYDHGSWHGLHWEILREVRKTGGSRTRICNTGLLGHSDRRTKMSAFMLLAMTFQRIG